MRATLKGLVGFGIGMAVAAACGDAAVRVATRARPTDPASSGIVTAAPATGLAALALSFGWPIGSTSATSLAAEIGQADAPF